MVESETSRFPERFMKSIFHSGTVSAVPFSYMQQAPFQPSRAGVTDSYAGYSTAPAILCDH